MNKFIDRTLLIILLISIAGFIQRDVPILSIIDYPIYKILIALISSVYIIKLLCIKKRKSSVLGSLFYFLVLNVFSYVITDNGNHFSFFSAIISYIIPIFPIYYFTFKKYISDKNIKFIFLFFLVISILTYFNVRESYLDIHTHKEDMTNNMSYLLVSMFPFILLYKREYRYLLALLIFSFVLFSAKRGAIICSLLSILFVVYYTDFYGKKIKAKSLFLISLFLIVATYVFLYIFETNQYLYNRLTIGSSGEDVTSGRFFIYNFYLNVFLNSDIFQLFFGHGFNATRMIGNIHAHNDWLEVLVDYGLLGGVIFLCFYISLFRERNRIKSALVPILKLTLLLIFVKTFFSMSFFTESMSINCVILGYVLSNRIEGK